MAAAQHFRLYTPTTSYDVADNLSWQPPETLRETMAAYIHQFALAPEGRYVALGDAGDAVIYDNGAIDQMSDSG